MFVAIEFTHIYAVKLRIFFVVLLSIHVLHKRKTLQTNVDAHSSNDHFNIDICTTFHILFHVLVRDTPSPLLF